MAGVEEVQGLSYAFSLQAVVMKDKHTGKKSCLRGEVGVCSIG